jgi:nicotinate phosphoribosyltransferase
MNQNYAPVIRSLEENDNYKDTMRQVFLHKHPAAMAEYEFFCRNTPEYPLTELKADVERELDHLCSLTYTQEALDYKRGLRYMKSDYVDFLSLFRYQRRFIEVTSDGERLCIKARGPQVHIMGFEIHCMNIVSELYFRRFDQEALLAEGRKRLNAKIALLKEFRKEAEAAPRRHAFEFFDFGLRRRFSGAWQEEVVTTLAREVPDFFKGTSNVYLARKLGLTPIGTMAHEFLQSYQAFGGRLRDFQKAALEDWVQEYRGDLGTALTDCVGMDAFLADFDLYHGKLWDGLRHDSGDPYVWGEKAIAHYEKLRIDANTKRLTWSDGLNIPKSLDLYRHFGDRVNTGFGIGTDLMNDMGVDPLNLIMKLVFCNGQPVAKLPDSPGKTLCKDPVFMAYISQLFNRPYPY